MGSRERKRAERQKRKRRSAAERAASAAAPAAANGEAGSATAESEESFAEKMARRSEARNAAARAELEPLERGERPGAVTAGAIVSAALGLVFTGSALVAATGSVEISGEEPQVAPLALIAAALWLMTWGMWRARYWAVLGFQMLMVLVLLSAALGLVQVSTIAQLVGTLILIGGAGTLFYLLIRAMARIQMPERPGER